MKLSVHLFGEFHRFADVKDVLAKAGNARSGDILAGIAALTGKERVAAKHVLSELSLADLRENPVVPYEQDSVTRVIQDAVHANAYARIRNWTVGELREWLLADSTTLTDIEYVRKGLTAEMIAAVSKICSNADLIYGARRIAVIKRANSTLGVPGTFASRLQPNDTRDDLRSIRAQIFEGLSYGAGDALIGINPVTDNVESCKRMLHQIYEVIDQYAIPTQGCVLAHVTTQMEAVRQGAPCGLIFQSLCGSEKGLREFGISVEMIDEASQIAHHYNRVGGPNVMYFETGQGSALSANAHHGADQTTMEARNYGLAARWDPFMVNTVVGFIGPEYLYNDRQIIRAGLEDHFMGKLSGLSMGCDCCYTNHAEADQNTNENLGMLLAAAGCNFIINSAMGDDVMLNYQTLAFHDIATIRQVLGLRPAREFEQWLEARGIMQDGRLSARAGDASLFFTAEAA